MKSYDCIVVGAGHAGCEAAFAAARLGAQVLLITFNMDHIAQMSCNPAIGGIAKGQVVDSDNLITLSAEHLTESQTADTAKTVNCNFDARSKFLPS